jgi:3-methylfumaryl-CoA hydratase
MQIKEHAMNDASTIDDLRQWIGRSDSHEEAVAAWQAGQLAALFDWPAPPKDGDPLPYLWHWANAFPVIRRGSLGVDGHPAPGTTVLPPIPLPRRMWAGATKPNSTGRDSGNVAARICRPVQIFCRHV